MKFLKIVPLLQKIFPKQSSQKKLVCWISLLDIILYGIWYLLAQVVISWSVHFLKGTQDIPRGKEK